MAFSGRLLFAVADGRDDADRFADQVLVVAVELVRSTEDALQEAGLIRDDARICRLTASKHEIPDGWTGAVVTITTIPTT